MTALFAALACVATMSIRIPTPGTNGYIHPGDAIVILSGVILGGIADIILVAGGYFLCESTFLGYGPGAIASVPANVIQGIGGLIISCILYPIIISIPNIRPVSPATK